MPDRHVSRRSALGLLEAVLRDQRPFDEAWRSFVTAPAGASLEARDRAFIRQMVATTFRRLGQIDAVIAHLLDRPLAAKRARANDILRLGAAQILFMRTPAHAAVDAAVSLAAGDARAGIRSLKGLVNAVLRRIAAEGRDLIATRFADETINTPGWLRRSWHAAYGKETAVAIMAAHLVEPPLDITLKQGQEPGEWRQRLGAEILPTGSLRRPGGGRVEALPGYGDGAWWIQDAAAAIPARLFGDISGRRVIDLCAAPGGKSAQLASLGARVVAVDRSATRLLLLAENFRRLRLEGEIIEADATTWRPQAPAHFVLLDAPCSGTGAIRRHPDIAHLKSHGDVLALAALQDELIAAALGMLGPGGTLIYSVCSLEPEEGRERVEAVIAARRDVTRRIIEPDEIEGIATFITPEGDLRTLPHYLSGLGGIDGFYIARLKKEGG